MEKSYDMCAENKFDESNEMIYTLPLLDEIFLIKRITLEKEGFSARVWQICKISHSSPLPDRLTGHAEVLDKGYSMNDSTSCNANFKFEGDGWDANLLIWFIHLTCSKPHSN